MGKIAESELSINENERFNILMHELNIAHENYLKLYNKYKY